MEGVQAVEGELNGIIKEYLHMLNYGQSVKKFESETKQNGKEIILEKLPPSVDESQLHLQNVILQAFDNGNTQAFTRLWSENIPDKLQEESSCQRLEFNIQLYFAVFPIKHGISEQNKIDKALKSFKLFLETRGASLSQTTEFVAFYALPFVPASSLKSHPSFSVLFQDSWSDELRMKLEDFLSTVLYSAPLPYLYKLFIGSKNQSQTEKQQYENHIEALQQQISEHEHRATQYFKRYTKIQADYRNLINISAELVDSLENAVRGKMVTPEYLRNICERLLKNGQNPMQSTTDFARPGTASSMLRASVNNFNGVAIGDDVPYLPSLNYAKIKEDLRKLPARKKAILLQALRLRLVKASSGEQRDAAVSSYVANDILGCASDIQHAETMVNLLNAKEELLRIQTSLFFNTVASFTAGRAYIGQSEPMMKEMISRLKKESEKTACGENLLGAMQKLSLRRQVQTIMIDYGLVQWLVVVLEEPETLSDYTLEYAVALLMNLCLRSSGKKRCLSNCENILKLLADLLGHENKEIRPYVNGTLYSILALTTIRQKAVSMGLEEILRCYIQDDDEDTNRQINFIIKQMNSNDPNGNDDPHSDTEDDDDDDDEEGDVIDAELDEEEIEIAKTGELSKEQLLSAHYLGVLSSLSVPKGKLAKSVSDSLSSTQEMPLTRPITPRTQPKLNPIQERNSRENDRPSLSSRNQERPKTQSSGSSRRNQGRESSMSEGSKRPTPRERPNSNRGTRKLDPFQTKPKIPRTPEIGSEPTTPFGSRPTSQNAPPPTKSVSPPLPRPSSKDTSESFPRCQESCSKFDGRHFHCDLCPYATQRMDNFKRHIKYHLSSNNKERRKTPDCMKKICNEYFTTKCPLDVCRYEEKGLPHFHCLICKEWSCNSKKSFKYRLDHLRSRHNLFFKDIHQLEDFSDKKVIKRMKRLQRLGLAKFLPGKCHLTLQTEIMNGMELIGIELNGEETDKDFVELNSVESGNETELINEERTRIIEVNDGEMTSHLVELDENQLRNEIELKVKNGIVGIKLDAESGPIKLVDINSEEITDEIKMNCEETKRRAIELN